MEGRYYKKLSVMVFALLLVLVFGHPATGADPKAEAKTRVLEKARSLQVPFIENRGQIDDASVKYYAKTFGGTAFITEDGRIIYSLPKTSKGKGSVIECRGEPCVRPAAESDQTKGWVISERFIGASIAAVRGEDPAATSVSYFKGNDPAKWKSALPTYDTVSLGEIYNGIELKLKAYGNNMEKLFHVHPGADPAMIKVRLAERPAAGGIGASGGRPLGLSVNDKGELEIETGLGVVKFTKPVAYQEEMGRGTARRALARKYVEVSYAVEGDGYSFKVGEYDRSRELFIDPLLASTFIGGSSYEATSYDDGQSIAPDASGNVYVAGYTGSSDFSTTPGAYDTAYNGAGDGFVAKLDSGLTPPSYTLTVSKSGSGAVTSSPVGISCSADCAENYAPGTSVTLTATPDTGWSFTGWSGCDSSSGATCYVTLNSNTTVSATFTQLIYTLTVSVSGNGTVTSSPSGISCGADCTENYASYTQIALTATPDTGWSFGGWAGCDSASVSSCYLVMDSIETVTAIFAQPTSTIAITGISPNLGTTAGGCPVSVAGTGFQAPSILFIGNMLSEQISVSSDTLITAVTPHGSAPEGSSPAPVSVVVVNEGKSSDPATDQVTFTYVHPADFRDTSGNLNSDGHVSIAEVQSAINMFLTGQDVKPQMDSNCDARGKINEVQQAINSFLALP